MPFGRLYRYDVDGGQDARCEARVNREQANAMYDASKAVWESRWWVSEA